jgi:hypothetical protein
VLTEFGWSSGPEAPTGANDDKVAGAAPNDFRFPDRRAPTFFRAFRRLVFSVRRLLSLDLFTLFRVLLGFLMLFVRASFFAAGQAQHVRKADKLLGRSEKIRCCSFVFISWLFLRAVFCVVCFAFLYRGCDPMAVFRNYRSVSTDLRLLALCELATKRWIVPR